MSFAKLFETEEVGQILVKIDIGEEGKPEVRYFFEPENLGVCSMALSFKDDSDESWGDAEKAFNKSTEEVSIKYVRGIIESIKLDL